ncbi:unnamed protein product [Lota lota]
MDESVYGDLSSGVVSVVSKQPVPSSQPARAAVKRSKSSPSPCTPNELSDGFLLIFSNLSKPLSRCVLNKVYASSIFVRCACLSISPRAARRLGVFMCVWCTAWSPALQRCTWTGSHSGAPVNLHTFAPDDTSVSTATPAFSSLKRLLCNRCCQQRSPPNMVEKRSQVALCRASGRVQDSRPSPDNNKSKMETRWFLSKQS